MRVTTTPELGAKITSIVDKRADYEWLITPEGRTFGSVPYGAEFIAQDMSGWDEMFPTIQPCAYPGPEPFTGVALPDHGEVWALPWTVEDVSDGGLMLGVNGRALPYHLTRHMTLSDSDTLTLEYHVMNTGCVPIAVLWAAHPQFTATDDTRIVLPDHVKELYNVRETPEFGEIGTRYTWPLAKGIRGRLLKLDRVASSEAGTCRKLYVSPETSVRWAGLQQVEGDHWLRLVWSPEEVPYLGIWVDEGAVNSESTAALEITTGFHDSLGTAWEHQRCPVVPPGGSMSWRVEVGVGSGDIAPDRSAGETSR